MEKQQLSNGKDGMLHSLNLLKDTYNYNHWVYDLMRRFIGDRVMEVGSGPGNLTRFLLPADRLVCVEPDPDFASQLSSLCRCHTNITLIRKSINDIKPEDIQHQLFDTILSANVLEHIEDDHYAVQVMASLLAPGGHLVLYVPALMWAYGTLDHELGHFRRYTKRNLRALLEGQGLRIVHARYVNFVGAFGWWWAGRVRRERFIDPKKARMVDAIVPYLEAIEGLIPPILGQSVLVVGEKATGQFRPG